VFINVSAACSGLSGVDTKCKIMLKRLKIKKINAAHMTLMNFPAA
jgi:hypothetical protein